MTACHVSSNIESLQGTIKVAAECQYEVADLTMASINTISYDQVFGADVRPRAAVQYCLHALARRLAMMLARTRM
ncbi:hypothetical protein Tco_0664783 [Tanacetum coccineum]